MASLLLINGPNLNLLGSREPSVYGNTNLAAVEQALTGKADAAGLGWAEERDPGAPFKGQLS